MNAGDFGKLAEQTILNSLEPFNLYNRKKPG